MIVRGNLRDWGGEIKRSKKLGLVGLRERRDACLKFLCNALCSTGILCEAGSLVNEQVM